jgi:hypothetical protein
MEIASVVLDLLHVFKQTDGYKRNFIRRSSKMEKDEKEDFKKWGNIK